MFHLRARPLIAALLLLAWPLSVPAPCQPPGAGDGAPTGPSLRARPRIGLALGGGAARGLAHVGVLQWLEEHRIPVDLIAGTSMGGLVGGAYATGMSPSELRTLMRRTDWDAVLQSDSRFADKTFRRKQDKRAFPAHLELGVRGRVTLPRGINPGQDIGLMLDRIALPYYDVERFDDLPTPFRCLAMDLRTARPVVLDEGSLSRAMRATMAIPGVFTPVSLGDWLLVDGGVVNNVPGDVVRGMGADIVIAVDVSAASQRDTPARLDKGDLFTVLDRTLDAMMAAGARQGLEQATLVLVPDLQGLDATAWRSSDALADRGYRAAAAASRRLLPYALSEAEFAEHVKARDARRRISLPQIGSIAVAGVGPGEQADIRAALSSNVGSQADPDRIERGIRRVAGTDRYESVDYRIGTGPAGTGLLVTVHPKTYGPPFLAFGLDVNNIDASHVSANLAARLTTYGTVGARSEMRTDAVVGTRQALAHEALEPLGASPLFVAARGSLSREDRAYFSGYRSLGESRIVRAGTGLDVGILGAQSAEVRLGLDAAVVRGTPLVGTPSVARFDGSERFASLRATLDRQDSAVVPSRGLFLRGEVRRFFAAPRASEGDTPDGVGGGNRATLESPSRFWQGDFAASVFAPVHGHDRLFGQVAGGTSFGARPQFNDFSLGGPLRLGAFSPEQLRGPGFALGVGGYLKRAGRLPDMLGGDVYVGGWFETGSAFESLRGATWHRAVSAGIVLDSVLGPIFAGGSLGFDGHSRLYVAVGQLWR